MSDKPIPYTYWKPVYYVVPVKDARGLIFISGERNIITGMNWIQRKWMSIKNKVHRPYQILVYNSFNRQPQWFWEVTRWLYSKMYVRKSVLSQGTKP